MEKKGNEWKNVFLKQDKCMLSPLLLVVRLLVSVLTSDMLHILLHVLKPSVQ